MVKRTVRRPDSDSAVLLLETIYCFVEDIKSPVG
jgi:hypothetical protein